MNYVVRFSEHIQEDIQRGWSSWNFGAGGFEGTADELEDYLEEHRGREVDVSGINEWLEEDANISFDWIDGSKVFYFNDCEVRELYENYWVMVDRINNKEGELSCLFLDSENDTDAIEEGKSLEETAWGDGESFNPSNYELIFSEGQVNVFKLK